MGTPNLHVQHSHGLTDLITLFLHTYKIVLWLVHKQSLLPTAIISQQEHGEAQAFPRRGGTRQSDPPKKKDTVAMQV